MGENGSQEPATSEAAQARALIGRLATGQMATRAMSAAVGLGVFDQVADGRATVDEVAAACDADPRGMRRLLRALAAIGLAREEDPDVFALTAAGGLLRSDVPGSSRDFARVFGHPMMMRGWHHLEDSVRTGETGFDREYGAPFFSYLATQPELSRQFNSAMSQGTRLTAAQLPDHYDFGRFERVIDVGGGDGTLIASVLGKFPALRGAVYDTAEGLAQAPDRLAELGVAERCDLEVGDFFDAVPAGADLYLLKSVIHDWSDEQCAGILRRCREALPEHGRVLIVEPVLPPLADPQIAGLYLSDLNMLVNVGGRERTREDFDALCASAGLAVRTVSPLPAPNFFSLIEAARV